MKLSRIGANRKESRGIAFSNKVPEVSLDSKSGDVNLVVRYAEGMGAQGQYDYTIALSPKDISAILTHLSIQRSAFEPGQLQDILRESSPALLRLLFASSALPFLLAPTNTQLELQAAREKAAQRVEKSGG